MNRQTDKPTVRQRDNWTDMQELTEGRLPSVCSEANRCSWGRGCTAWCNTQMDRQRQTGKPTVRQGDSWTDMQVLTEGRQPPVCSEVCRCSWGWGCTAWCTSLTAAARDRSGCARSPWDQIASASVRQTPHSPPVPTGVTLSPICQCHRKCYITSVSKADTTLSTSADRCNTITDLSMSQKVLHHQRQ